MCAQIRAMPNQIFHTTLLPDIDPLYTNEINKFGLSVRAIILLKLYQVWRTRLVRTAFIDQTLYTLVAADGSAALNSTPLTMNQLAGFLESQIRAGLKPK